MRPRRMRLVAQGLVLAVVALALGADELPHEPADVRAALDAGRYAEAEAGARALLVQRMHDAASMPGEVSEARELLADALARLGRTRDPEALTLASAALAQREGDHEPAYDDASATRLADSLVVRARVLGDLGQWRAARADLERARVLRAACAQPDASALAALWEDWSAATLALRAGPWDPVEQALDEAARLRAEAGEHAPTAQARHLELRARLQRRGARYSEALVLAQQARALREAHDPQHPDLVQTCNLVGELHWWVRDFASAREAHERALELARRTLGPAHPVVAFTLDSLALAENDSGDVSVALPHQQEAVALARSTRSPGHPELFDLLQDLANMQQNRGDFEQADAVYRELLTWVPQHIAADSDQAATVHNNRGVLLRRMGDFDSARTEFEQALAIWQALPGIPPSYLTYPLEGLAEVAALSGDAGAAEQHLERVRAIHAQALAGEPEGSPAARRRALDLAWTLAMLADVVDRQGRAAPADDLATQALEQLRRAPAVESPVQARVLRLLGSLALRRGHSAQAVAWLSEARQRVAGLYGATHPDVAELDGRLAQALLADGQAPAARAAARQALALRARHQGALLAYLSPREALAYTNTEPRARDVLITLAAHGDAAARREAWSALLQTRAPVLEELQARRRALARDEDAGLADAKARLAHFYFRASADSDSYRVLLEQARQSVEALERARAERVRPGRGPKPDEPQLDYTAALAHLPRRARLVSFVAYCHVEPGAPATASDPSCVGQRRYAALVAHPGTRAAVFVPLADQRAVEAAVARWHAQVERVQVLDLLADERGPMAAALERRYRDESEPLSRLVWQPLAAHLKGAERVLLVPDGALQRVAFQALPDARPGAFLVEQRFALHHLPNERALLAPVRARATRGGLLALGIRRFEATTPRAMQATRPDGATSARVLRSGVRGLWFDELPGAVREATAVATAWQRATGSPATLLLDTAATKAALAAGVRGQRVVHLATHGFFLDGLAAAAVSARSGGARDDGAASALLHVGLALAGANRSTPNEAGAEGLLSAEELAELPLGDADWVVLSACGSGLGDVRLGEGVLGLQRALLIAGARSVVMSLWDVPDDEVPALMEALYDERFRRGRDTSAALQAAQRRRLEQRRREGRSTHPFLWAAFVAAGDWR